MLCQEHAATAPGLDIINGSECGQDQPGFGCNAVYEKLCSMQYYRVLNII